MISEIEFIREHTSFWRTLSPLSENFVKYINVAVLDRYEPEIDCCLGTSRRALINEVGFELFCLCSTEKCSLNDITDEQVSAVSKESSHFISQLRNKSPNFESNLGEDEIFEAKEISERLIKFFGTKCNLVVKPNFQGCGQLNACIGDVIADNTLYEIKSGDRNFKSIDLRQLVLYLTLNKISGEYNIDSLSLYNPRKGFHFQTSLNDFAMQFSGLTSEELCHRIEYELTSCDLARFEGFF